MDGHCKCTYLVLFIWSLFVNLGSLLFPIWYLDCYSFRIIFFLIDFRMALHSFKGDSFKGTVDHRWNEWQNGKMEADHLGTHWWFSLWKLALHCTVRNSEWAAPHRQCQRICDYRSFVGLFRPSSWRNAFVRVTYVHEFSASGKYLP